MNGPNSSAFDAAHAALLEAHLRRLRLPVILAEYAKAAQEAAQHGLAFDAFLLMLVEQEVAQRDENMQRRRLASAKFPALKTLDQYDFSLVPQLNRQLVLELARGGYLAKRENVLLAGAIGTGKTHLATALGVAACGQGHRVRFVTAAGLVNELLEAQTNHRLQRYERGLLNLQLLILDEVGFVPFTKLGADLLFSFLSAIHEQVSLIVTILWNQKSTGERHRRTSAAGGSRILVPGIGFSQVPTPGRRGAATRRLFWPSGSAAVTERRGAGFYGRRGAGPRRSSGT